MICTHDIDARSRTADPRRRRRARARVPLAFALALAACGCAGDPPPPTTALNAPVASDHARLTVVIEVGPAGFHRGANEFAVRVQNPDGSPGVLTHVTAIMPTHGHTANAPVLADQGGGRFGVSALDLTMPGEWQFDLAVSHSGARDDDQLTAWIEVD